MDPERIEAAGKGERCYQTPLKPCEKCSESLRYVSTGKCVSCTKKASRAVYEKNKRILEEAKKK